MSMNPFATKPSTDLVADEEIAESHLDVEVKPDTNIVSNDSGMERPDNDGLAKGLGVGTVDYSNLTVQNATLEAAEPSEPLTCENATHFKAPNGRVFAATDVLRRIAISDRKLQPCDAPQVAEDSE